VAADGYLYVLGGDQYNGSALTVSSQVLSSVINLDGSLGAWRTNTPLPLAVSSMGVAVWNHTIYVMGGINSQAFLISSQVFSATIQSNGTLSAWSTLTPLPSGLEAQGAAANGVLYAFGGTDGTSYLTAVYYSAINPDGSLAGWNQTTALPHPSVYLGSAAGSGYVFSTGGSDGTNTLSSLYLAPVMGGGAAGAWSNGPALPQPLEIFGCAVAGSNLYVAGGQNSGGAQSTVYSLPLPTAPISANLTGEGRSTNGNFQFKLSSSPNTGFGLRASPDLSNWTTIGWGFTDTNGSLTLQDTNTTAASSRFYRTYWPLP